MSAWLLLLAIALCGSAQAAAPPPVELTVTPAFKGWARPGRPTEVDIRISSRTATPSTIELRAGRLTLQTRLELQPGRAQRLQMPAAAADGSSVQLSLPGAPQALTQPVAIARAESPLLGVALAGEATVALDGFRTLALSADDLPRHAASHASLDALVLDAATMAALDAQQLAALLGHAAACGRVVLLHADAPLRHLLEGADACGGRALISADSPEQAQSLLAASLQTRLPASMSSGEAGALVRPDPGAWSLVAVALAAYATLLALLLVFGASPQILLAVPTLAAVAAWGLPQLLQPASQLVVWSEGESGAQLARYQAWQQVAGVARGHLRVAIPAQLGSAARPCDASLPMRFEFDAVQARSSFAEFDTRLFGHTALCYAGSFPIARAFALAPVVGGARAVRNTGPSAWPRGQLLAAGAVHDLPAVEPGGHATAAVTDRPAADDAVLRTARARIEPGGSALLWALDLAGVEQLPQRAQGWLLVSGAAR